MKHLKKITILEFHFCPVEDSLLEELVWGAEKQLCPNLIELKLHRSEGFSAEQLMKVVLSRQRNVDEAVTTPFTGPPAVLQRTQVIGSSLPISMQDFRWFGQHNVTWVD